MSRPRASIAKPLKATSVKTPRAKPRLVRGRASEKASLFPTSLLKKCLWCVLICLSVSLPVGVWHSGVIGRSYDAFTYHIDKALIKAGFHVMNILVEGRSHTTNTSVIQALKVSRGVGMLKVDPHMIQERLMALPWVRSAVVQRRFPNTLYVRLTERHPIALWQQEKGESLLVDDEGHLIKAPVSSSVVPYIIITGQGAPSKIPTLIKLLKNHPIVYKHVTGAVLVGERQWELIIDGRLRIKLSEDNLKQSLVRLRGLQESGYFARREVLSIDIRLPDRTFLFLTPEATARHRPGIKKKV